MKIIRDKSIVEDNWSHYNGEGAVPDGNLIVPLDVWRAEDFSGRKTGILLEPDTDVGDIREELEKVALVAINFPTFNDGRGYSLAKILRDRYGFTGEIRAVGDVMRDQLFYMQRCGFTAYEIKPGRDIEDALKAFDDFSVKYQASSDEHMPLYGRK